MRASRLGQKLDLWGLENFTQGWVPRWLEEMAKGRDEVLGLSVKDISISVANGKKLTDPGDWVSQKYREARRNYSAVESLMFTFKNGFEFGTVVTQNDHRVALWDANPIQTATRHVCQAVFLCLKPETRNLPFERLFERGRITARSPRA